MRICRQVNWTARVVTIKLVALVTVSSFTVGQSFDYPADSPSLLNRAGQSANVAPQVPVQNQQIQNQQIQNQQPQNWQQQNQQPQPHARPTSMFSKLLGRNNNARPVFASPQSQQSANQLPPNYSQANQGTQHSVYLSPYPVTRNGRVAGYQPDLEQSNVRPVAYERSNQPQQSILEREPSPQSQSQFQSQSQSIAVSISIAVPTFLQAIAILFT